MYGDFGGFEFLVWCVEVNGLKGFCYCLVGCKIVNGFGLFDVFLGGGV